MSLESENAFNIQPEISYFVANNFAIGLSVDYQRRSRSIFENTGGFNFQKVKLSSATNLMTPQLIYFYGINEKLKAFGKVKGGLAFQGFNNGSRDANDYGYVLGGVVGMSYFFNNTISADFGIGYNHINFGENIAVTNQFITNIGFSIFL